MRKKYHFLNLIVLSISSVVGVGFVSGAEIWSFFARFGSNIIITLPVLFLLLFCFCNKIVNDTENLKKSAIMQNNLAITQKNTKLKIKEKLLFVEFLLFSAAMISGLKNVISVFFNNGQVTVFLVCLIFVFFVVYFGINAISKFNFITVVLVGLIVLFVAGDINWSSDILFVSDVCVWGFHSFEAILFAVLYLFLNIAYIVPIFKSTNFMLTKKERYFFSSVFSFLFVVLIAILSIFLCKHSYLMSFDMPLLHWFLTKNAYLKSIFIFVLFAGILSTMFVSMESLKIDFLKIIKSKFLATFFVVFLSLILSFFPFKIFINFVYPFIAILNFINLCFL